jgi:hypothetical protein
MRVIRLDTTLSNQALNYRHWELSNDKILFTRSEPDKRW